MYRIPRSAMRIRKSMRHAGTTKQNERRRELIDPLQMWYSVTRKHEEVGYKNQLGKFMPNHAKLREGKDLTSLHIPT